MNIAQLSSSVIFIIMITILTGENLNNCKNPNDICLSNYVIPVHYRIKLIHLYTHVYDSYRLLNLKNEKDSFNFHGESRITINILWPTQYIKMHMLDLINYQNYKLSLIKNNGIIYALKGYVEISETNLIEFFFSNVLSPGLYTFKIEFLGLLTENSAKNFFKSFYTNKGNRIAWVQYLKIHINT